MSVNSELRRARSSDGNAYLTDPSSVVLDRIRVRWRPSVCPDRADTRLAAGTLAMFDMTAERRGVAVGSRSVREARSAGAFAVRTGRFTLRVARRPAAEGGRSR
jgi:hypothetical protein